MTPKIIIGLIIAVAVVAAGAWYFSRPHGAPAPASAAEAEKTGTFSDLMAKSGSWKCTATATHQEGASAGTVLIQDGKLRGDFTSTMAGRSVNTSFVAADGYIYTWSDLLPQGMKVKATAAAGTSGGQGIDPSTQVDYSCDPWTAEANAFALPSGIQFYDMSAGSASLPFPS